MTAAAKMDGAQGGLSTKRSPRMAVTGRLFQARMWRKYAMEWDLPTTDLRRRWVESILQISRADCVRRARVNVRLARRLNRRAAIAKAQGGRS